MYIAFKWLTAMALSMWLAMCIIDFYLKNSKENRKKDLGMDLFGWTYKNLTEQKSDSHATKLYEQKYPRIKPTVLHYAMFFIGAITVSVFNKKRLIMSYTKHTIAKIKLSETMNICTSNLKKTATIINVAMLELSACLWVISRTVARKIKNIKLVIKTNVTDKHMRLNLILINKLKNIGEERRKLCQLLFVALYENKNIRTEYQVQNMAKNRLFRSIEDTNKRIKENRSKYVSFQHLYLVTHQENAFLKALVRKLTTEKENAESGLMEIVNEIYLSKNSALKAYCSRFIVRPKNNLLNRNVSAEVQKFLNESKKTSTSWQVPRANNEESMEPCSVNDHFTENFHDNDETLIPLQSNGPKLKGLPGECIWTVKDKYGIIEKLYEYDYKSNFDNGETIRRIREYSVYHDKDCLLDSSSSRTFVTRTAQFTPSTSYRTTGRFLTGSEAFQNFLQSNKNIVIFSRSPTHPILI